MSAASAGDSATEAAEGYKLVGKLHPTTLYNARWIKYIEQMANRWFETYTGQKISFTVTPHSQPYMSNWGCSVNLWQSVIPLLTERPTVWEPMCGGGSDSIIMLHLLDVMHLWASDKMLVAEHEITRNNLKNYMSRFEEFKNDLIPVMDSGNYDAKVCLFRDYSFNWIPKFARHCEATNKSKKITIIYADPSYNERYMSNLNDIEQDAVFTGENTARKDVGPDVIDTAEVENTEVTPAVLLASLEAQIFKHLEKHGIENEIFILKVRWQLTPAALEIAMKSMGSSSTLYKNYTCRFAIQALPNIKDRNRKWSQSKKKFVIIDHEGNELKEDVYGKVKGQFYWLVFTSKRYQVRPDDRTWWYQREILPDDVERSDVWVKKSSFVQPYKPSYTKKLPQPDVIPYRKVAEDVSTDFFSLSDTERELYTKIRATISKTETMTKDLLAYITEITQYMVLLARHAGDHSRENTETKKKIHETIAHVTSFYIRNQEYYRQKQGRTAKVINGLVIKLVETVEDAKYILEGHTPMPADVIACGKEFKRLEIELQRATTGIEVNATDPKDILFSIRQALRMALITLRRTAFLNQGDLQRFSYVLEERLKENEIIQIDSWIHSINAYTNRVQEDASFKTYVELQSEVKRWQKLCQFTYTDNPNFKDKNIELDDIDTRIQGKVHDLRNACSTLQQAMNDVEADMQKDKKRSKPSRRNAKKNATRNTDEATVLPARADSTVPPAHAHTTAPPAEDTPEAAGSTTTRRETAGVRQARTRRNDPSGVVQRSRSRTHDSTERRGQHGRNSFEAQAQTDDIDMNIMLLQLQEACKGFDE